MASRVADKRVLLGWLALTAAIIGLDRLTKFLASAHLAYNDPVAVLPFFNLTLLHNTGAAFSLLDDAGGWQRWLFTAIALLVSAVLLRWLARIAGRNAVLSCALSLLLAGALGNLWDRLAYGYVVDFVELYYRQWSFPAFNVADSAITVGAALLILDTLREARRDRG